VTTPAFLVLWGLASLRDLLDFAKLERRRPARQGGARSASATMMKTVRRKRDDGDGDQERAGVGLFEE
jgi:hypothetical protein